MLQYVLPAYLGETEVQSRRLRYVMFRIFLELTIRSAERRMERFAIERVVNQAI